MIAKIQKVRRRSVSEVVKRIDELIFSCEDIKELFDNELHREFS